MGFTLFALIISFGPVSGGHFNPAVSTAVLVKEGMSNLTKHIVYYLLIISAQIIGAIVGVCLVALSQQKDSDLKTIFPGIALLCPGVMPTRIDETKDIICSNWNSAGSVFMVEMIVTFIFTNVILTVKYHFGSKELLINAASIGTTLFAMIVVTGELTGGCLNPAIGLVQPVF